MEYDAFTHTATGAYKYFLLAWNINQIMHHKCMCGFHTVQTFYEVRNDISTRSVPLGSIHMSIINVV